MSVIVSLTSYGRRLSTLHYCLKSIFSQSYKPDKIILNLHKDELIPEKVRLFFSEGLTVRRFSHSYGPHNKYLYIMREYPNDIVITLDDDVLYPGALLELLMRSYKKYPNIISAGRAHRIRLDANGYLLPYVEWEWEAKAYEVPSISLFATGVGGVLYPPHCLHSDALDTDKIKKFSLYADDIWLKIMQVLNKTPVVIVKQKTQHPPPVSDIAEDGLFVQNKLKGRNDQYLKRLTEVYKIDWERMMNLDKKRV